MNSEERFKKSLEELLESKSFPFDEGNWEKARHIIDASKQKRRITPLVLASLLLFVSMLTGIFFLAGISDVPVEKPEVSLESKALVLPLSRPNPLALLNESTVISPLSLSKAGKVIHPQKNIPAIPKNELVKPQLNPVANTPEPSSAEKQNSPEKNPVAEINPVSFPVNVNSGIKENDEIKNNDLPENEEVPVVNTIPQEQKPRDEQKSGTSPINDANPPEIAKSETLASVDKADLSVPAASDKSEEAQIPSSVVLPDSTKQPADPVTNLPIIDNDGGQLGKDKDYITLFSLEAGANYLFGWKNPGSRDALGYNPTIGINYFNTLNPKMSLTAGLHYSQVNNLSYSAYTSKVVRFGLGEESKVTIYTPVKMHYLIIPLRFNYNLTPKNTVGLGCNVGYLLNVESNVETYNEKLNSVYDKTYSTTNGYIEGFKKYDTQVSVFYKRTFYPFLAVNIEAFYGLTDIKDNRFFNSNVFERNTGLKLTLVYNFLKK